GQSLERAKARPAAQRMLAPVLPAPGTLTEHASKAYLAKLGVAIPRGGLAGDLAAARRLAAEIGFPLALKLQAKALPHKSGAGAVLLGIGDDGRLAEAWDALACIAGRHPGLVVDGVLVEAMAPPGLEMIVGARRDRDWGPVVLVGLGGVWAEALQDVCILPVDLGAGAVTV